MAVKLLMPKLGLNMVEGQVTEWLKSEGDAVKKGETIYIVETDKVTNEVEALQDGILVKILVKAGDVVPVRQVVGILAEEGEQVDIKHSWQILFLVGEVPKQKRNLLQAEMRPRPRQLKQAADSLWPHLWQNGWQLRMAFVWK